MNTVDLTAVRRVHFIGVGGIGISAIARMMVLEGKTVTANDIGEFEMVTALRPFGVDTQIGKDPEHIAADVDLIVYSIAWDTLAPELLAYARTRGVPVLSYPEMLGIISKEKYTIAVSGTHGKTTTTAMIAKVLMDAGLDPTVIVGSFLIDAQSNFVAGKSKYLVVEACEYKRSFLNLHPNILVITNIDNDHLDYYKDLGDIQSAFAELASRLGADDAVVTDSLHKNIVPALGGVVCHVRDYTHTDAAGKIVLAGEHNKKNARAALVVASILGIDEQAAISSLNTFKGTWRRFEYKGNTKHGALVYDDYAHHPTEVKATLSMAREMFPDKKIVVAFQPHLYSRTKDHVEEFASVFADADSVFLAPIYAAREPFDPSISSDILAQRMKVGYRGTVDSLPSLEMIGATLSECSDDVVVIVMGAGDITKVADMIIV